MRKKLDPGGRVGPRFRASVGGPPLAPWTARWPGNVDSLSSLPSLPGLQDKLNKRDKEVTALTSQTEMLRAQVSGKSPSRRAVQAFER